MHTFTLLSVLFLVLAFTASSSLVFAQKSSEAEQQRLIRQLKARFEAGSAHRKAAVKKQEQYPWTEIRSLEEEDYYGLRGMSYNETQPEVENPNLLRGKNVAILASHCFEECELTYPYIFLTRRGANVTILSPWWVKDGKIASCEFVRARLLVQAQGSFKSALENWDKVKYDLLFVPGGVWSSTVVRNDPDALELLRRQDREQRLISTVCSGSSVLINAGLAFKRKLTGSPSIAVDLTNAGAEYKDEAVVRDYNLITGRSPAGDDNQQLCIALRDALFW